MPEDVIVEDRDGIRVITLNRPEVRNAIDLETSVQVAEALTDLDKNDNVHVAVLTGAGGVFSAGMDLKMFARTGQRPIIAGRGLLGITEAPPNKPVLAAVQGYALGGGFEVALACDMIVAAKGTRFGLPEVTRGLVAAGGGLTRLGRKLPYNVTAEVLLTGSPLDAQRALDLGLVNAVVEADELMPVTLKFARTIAANAPLAVAASKKVLAASWSWRSDSLFQRQAELVDPVLRSRDAAEGATAFVEGRSPRWSGR